MLRTAQSLPPKGLSTLGFDARRFPLTPPACYRASWQLPGPDSHRQATTNFTLSDHPAGITSNLLGARMIGASPTRGSALGYPCAPSSSPREARTYLRSRTVMDL